MADEKRIATFEWLSQNLTNCKKGTPPTTKKCVTKGELLTNYYVDESLLTSHTDKRLITRERCVCQPVLTVSGKVTNSIDLQSSEKIIAVGDFTVSNGCFGIVSYNLDGTVNSDFNYGKGFILSLAQSDIVKCVKVLSNGKILVGGRFRNYNDNTSYSNLIRLNADGSVDTSFINGFQSFVTQEVVSNVNDILIDYMGRIILAGRFYRGRWISAVRLNSDGSFDKSWERNDGGIGYKAVLLPDNSVIICGDSLLKEYEKNSSTSIYYFVNLMHYKSNGVINRKLIIHEESDGSDIYFKGYDNCRGGLLTDLGNNNYQMYNIGKKNGVGIIKGFYFNLTNGEITNAKGADVVTISSGNNNMPTSLFTKNRNEYFNEEMYTSVITSPSPSAYVYPLTKYTVMKNTIEYIVSSYVSVVNENDSSGNLFNIHCGFNVNGVFYLGVKAPTLNDPLIIIR